jgi:hypothetical protein
MATVVISHWSRHPTHNLTRLIKQLYKYDAGAPFKITVVCNGGDILPLKLLSNLSKYGIRILDRENSGYNIGAWDHGWRHSDESGYFLFLQDECNILKDGWLRAFIEKMESNPTIGLLGESINWRRPWKEQRLNPIAAACLNNDNAPPFNAIDFLHNFLTEINIPPTDSADHLQSLVLFTSRRILEQVGGFPSRNTYAEAVGTEIAISKLIQSHGYIFDTVGAKPFSYVGHRQWSNDWYKRIIKTKLFLRPYKAKVEDLFKKIAATNKTNGQ